MQISMCVLSALLMCAIQSRVHVGLALPVGRLNPVIKLTQVNLLSNRKKNQSWFADCLTRGNEKSSENELK